MAAPRWASQDSYDAVIYSAVNRYGGVTVPLVKAVIATESGFNAQAYREEPATYSLPPTADFPAGGDASYGLMQVLSRTARGLGYRGTLNGLFDPATNVDLGVRLMADNLRRASGTVADSVSAYNGGFRPTLGYGKPLGGKYTNQSYVDRVLQNLDYFRQWEAAKGGTSALVADSFRMDRSGRAVVAGHEEARVESLFSRLRYAIIFSVVAWAALALTCSYLGG